jgi:formiminotetrahydrofolate cyclodeaminase
MELNLKPWLELMASHDPTPAGGSLALATLAGGAALASKCARLSGAPHQTFDTFICDFHRFAAQDCDAYAALVSGDPAKADEAQRVSLRHLQSGLEFLEKASALKGGCKSVLAPDLNAACGLAAAAIRVLLGNLEANASTSAKRGVSLISEPAALRECRMQLSRLGF